MRWVAPGCVFVLVVDHAAGAKRSLQVDLMNGPEVLLVDRTIKVWKRRALVIGTIAPWSGSPAADPWLFDRLELQVSGCDAVIAPPPLAKVKQPQTTELDQPSEWAVTERLPENRLRHRRRQGVMQMAHLILLPERIRAKGAVQPGHRRHPAAPRRPAHPLNRNVTLDS